MHTHSTYLSLCVLICECVYMGICLCTSEKIESLSTYFLIRVKQFAKLIDLFLGNFQMLEKRCQLENYKICDTLEDYIKLPYI